MATNSRTAQDIAFLLFGQAMPGLDSTARASVVDCLDDGDYDVAIMSLVKSIDSHDIDVDADLLADARDMVADLLALA